jgi:lambda repressor-like predicted transcriptional regulator
MDRTQTVAAWMQERGMSVAELEDKAVLDHKVLHAILHGQYTPSPQQRQRIADALGVTKDAIAWGHTIEVAHLYGHGPQFGRTP